MNTPPSRLIIAAGLALSACSPMTPGPAPQGVPAPACYDRTTQPHTAVVDSHLHFRAFGGPSVPFEEVMGYLRETGVRFVNIYGIGQMLPIGSLARTTWTAPGHRSSRR